MENLAQQHPVQKDIVGLIAAALAAIGTIWILGIMMLICADVIARSAFNHPILGVPEMAQFSIVGIVFLHLPETLRAGGLTRTDVLLSRVQRASPLAGHVLEIIFQLVGLALCAIIVRTTWPLMLRAFEFNEFYGATGVVQVPTGPLKAIIITGATVMALQLMLGIGREAVAALRAVKGSGK